jgi:type IV pilus assembly protein PilO
MTVMLDSKTASTQRMTARTRKLLNLKNIHFAGVAVLALICLYLLAQMAYAWQSAKSQDASAVAQQTAAMRSAEVAAKPLAGLDAKLKQATVESDEFYAKRLPFARSEVLAEMGALEKKQNVRISRVQYGETPVLDETAPSGALTKVQMDASLTGDYRPLVLFINGLERDKMFFVIGAMALTGQQSGTVGVRLRITTYLRVPMGSDNISGVVGDPDSDSDASPQGGAAR